MVRIKPVFKPQWRDDNLSKAALQLIAPNPWTNTTTIRYFIPVNAGNTTINIVAANGTVVKTYTGLQKGSEQLTIKGSELSAGVYIAELVVNGLKMNSKQMVLNK